MTISRPDYSLLDPDGIVRATSDSFEALEDMARKLNEDCSVGEWWRVLPSVYVDSQVA